METTDWQQQTNTCLYPSLLWSKPENKAQAGKLLIIGGNSHGFSSVSKAYLDATNANIGEVKVMVPDSLKATLGNQPFISDFLPSSVGGGFAKNSLSNILASAAWANATWLIGDFGKGSEVTLLLEAIVNSTHRLVVAGDAIDHFIIHPEKLLNRPDTLVLPDFSQLQKLSSRVGIVLSSQMGMIAFVEKLSELTTQHTASLLIEFESKMVLSVAGKVVTSPKTDQLAHAAVWWLQFPTKPLEALACGLWEVLSS